jgi:hypothetical protein
MLKKITILFCLMFSANVFADDWGHPGGTIETMYIYPGHVVIVQSASYVGTAGCNSNNSNAWSFYWGDFDVAHQQRIYSTLLAAKLAKTPFKPIFSSVGCGPEGYRKFNGMFVM